MEFKKNNMKLLVSPNLQHKTFHTPFFIKKFGIEKYDKTKNMVKPRI